MNNLPENSVILNFDQVQNELKKQIKKSESLLISDVILILLYSHINKPIYGRTLIMKQLFLLYKEILEKTDLKIQDPKFIPYIYGPYSFSVMQVIDDLFFSGNIIIKGRKNSRNEEFKISDNAIKKVSKKYSQLSDEIRDEIAEKRIGWDQLGIDGILRYVYLNYPKYKEKSKIKEKYEDIIWGKGKA